MVIGCASVHFEVRLVTEMMSESDEGLFGFVCLGHGETVRDVIG